MRIIAAVFGTTLLLAGCSIPFTTSSGERKSPCDQIAAQVIQTSSPEEAKTLAAEASECYALAQQG